MRSKRGRRLGRIVIVLLLKGCWMVLKTLEGRHGKELGGSEWYLADVGRAWYVQVIDGIFPSAD